MKKIFITFCLLVLSCSVFSQQIKNKNVEIDDFITLLGAAGYELFSYDVTEMLNERYDITLVIKEFSAGKEIESSNLTTVSNKTLLTDIPESNRQKFIDRGHVIDPQTQAIAHVQKINFGFYPSDNDSTKLMQINIPDFMIIPKVTFKLKGLANKHSDKMFFAYRTRPFKMKTLIEDEFIPLILLGSCWYDEQFDRYRFCGEREIDPDMSSKILEYVPHHYIIGVRFVKKQ